jgi:bifunctional DNA-binding transcriptional regulator/antitoxin component of YhaV-PrlF toxin-antitoxin module
MSKVTSKLQVTVPKTIAERFNTKPGDVLSRRLLAISKSSPSVNGC